MDKKIEIKGWFHLKGSLLCYDGVTFECIDVNCGDKTNKDILYTADFYADDVAPIQSIPLPLPYFKIRVSVIHDGFVVIIIVNEDYSIALQRQISLSKMITSHPSKFVWSIQTLLDIK